MWGMEHTSHKTCQNCGARFSRSSNISNTQWDQRKYCSTKCQIRPQPQFIPCRICGEPTKYRGNTESRLFGQVRCLKQECIEASRALKNATISNVARQMYEDGERGLSPESRASISTKLTGRKIGPYSEAHRQAISAAKKGKPASPGVWKALRASAEARRLREHNNNGLKGYKQTEEHKRKRALASVGRTMSDDTRRRISEAQKGRVRSEAHRRKLSEALSRRWDAGEFNAYRSQLEIRCGESLLPLGFTAQFRISRYRHPYDYGHAERRILVEVHGCYWHQHGCGKRPRKDDVKTRDARHASKAAELGYKLVVLWQCEEDQWPDILRDAGVL